MHIYDYPNHTEVIKNSGLSLLKYSCYCSPYVYINFNKCLKLDFTIKQKAKPPPVSVVDVLAERRDSERVLNPLSNLSAVTPRRLHAFHHVSACRREIPLSADHVPDNTSQMSHPSEIYGTCICPAKQGALRVVSQAVWQAEVVFHQHPPVGTVHVRRLNLGGVAVPVSPVQVAVVRGR